MAFPGTRQQRALYIDAKRVRDEVGKGQEVLRQFGPIKLTQAGATTVRGIVGIPDVPIRIVSVKLVGEGLATMTTLDLIALGLDATDEYDATPATDNQLITQIATEPADDTVEFGVLTALALNVPAEHPIELSMVSAGGTGTIECIVSYILRDDERTFSTEV